MFYIRIRANLISKTVESSKLMMSHVIVVACVMTYRVKIYRLNHVLVSHHVVSHVVDGLHDVLGNRDNNGDDGAHADAHGVGHDDAAHAPHEILLGFSYLSPLFNESLYIMLD